MEPKPKTFDMSFGPLREVAWLADRFSIPVRTAKLTLEAMGLHLFYIGDYALYNHNAFESIAHLLTKSGGPGFACPGSYFKNIGSHRRKRTTNLPLLSVTPDIVQRAGDPQIQAEMAASSGRNPELMGKFVPRKLNYEGNKRREARQADLGAAKKVH